MKIHPLWFVCICARLLLIFVIRNTTYKNILSLMLLLMGSDFIYKGYFGSNNEIQFSKVFWHETRYLHGALYLLSSYYNYKNNIKMTTLTLILDLMFSFMYRFLL